MPENGRKNIFQDKQTNKQGIADVFRCESANRKVRIALLDSANKKQGTVYVFSI